MFANFFQKFASISSYYLMLWLKLEKQVAWSIGHLYYWLLFFCLLFFRSPFCVRFFSPAFFPLAFRHTDLQHEVSFSLPTSPSLRTTHHWFWTFQEPCHLQRRLICRLWCKGGRNWGLCLLGNWYLYSWECSGPSLARLYRCSSFLWFLFGSFVGGSSGSSWESWGNRISFTFPLHLWSVPVRDRIRSLAIGWTSLCIGLPGSETRKRPMQRASEKNRAWLAQAVIPRSWGTPALARPKICQGLYPLCAAFSLVGEGLSK